MAGKRVLLAAELLRGRATLTRLLPLGKALAALGHSVSFAVPAAMGAEVGGFPVVRAPRWDVPPPPGYVAISYPDVLMHSGYAAPDALRGLMAGWRTVLEHVRPDWVVVDFAPTAVLAARVAGLPVAAVGDGFSLPPLTAPLPGMRPWARLPPDEIASVEGRVLAVINARLRADGTADLRALRDLFDGVPRFLCAFAELDHYGARAESDWYGAVFPSAVAAIAGADAVYVDLDPRHPALPKVLAALDGLGLPALTAQAGTVPPADCTIVVCQSVDVAAPALLAGKPLLMLPVFVEQMMTVHRVARQGFGHWIDPGSVTTAIGAAVERLLADSVCRKRAEDFARAYDGYRPEIAIDAVAEEIDAMVTA